MLLTPSPILEPEYERLMDDIRIALVAVPEGSFMMGSEENERESPVHRVTVPNFYLGRYPVTNAEYAVFVSATGKHAPEWREAGSQYNIHTGTDDHYKKLGSAVFAPEHPVVGVSWNDATAFCRWLSQETGKRYGLPSEAQWEYAARGGARQQPFAYAGSHRLEEVGWFNKNSRGSTQPVGLKFPNRLGLYDMSGNVREWCADHWHKNYEGAPTDGSTWTKGGETAGRVVRGGSLFDYGYNCRVSGRVRLDFDYRYGFNGFRLARY